MNYWYLVLAAALPLGLATTVAAQTISPRVITCDTTVAPRSALRVQDEASSRGAIVEDVALIDLPNGMKSVQFSVRNALEPRPFSTILKVRYTVQWTDDCGRRITTGGQSVDGLALDPRRQEIIQSTAMDAYATHAFLRVYVEN
ncbi:hypothetical protein KVP09_01195 [Alcaligenaceae bacterium CGII-47]|nr:hypothetical protein [Alcaligenaceae bacterium CGII-47]